MRSAIDTNVISALWSKESTAPRLAGWLNDARLAGSLVISAPVLAELLAYPGATSAFVTDFLATTDIGIDFSLGEDVWRAAGAAFSSYADRRRRAGGGTPKRLLVDFMIGAHAELRADRLLTLDAERYRAAFPGLRLPAPLA